MKLLKPTTETCGQAWIAMITGKPIEEVKRDMRRSDPIEANPKAGVFYFLGGDSATLIGNVEFIEDRAAQESIWKEADRKFFKKGLDDTKLRLNHFHTIEATYWIKGKFRTCKYK